MRWVTCHAGSLQVSAVSSPAPQPDRIVTGLEALDDLLPPCGLMRGAVHEVLTSPAYGIARTFALVLAKAFTSAASLVWSDPRGELYPPALLGMGIEMDRFMLLRPPSPEQEMWAITECMRCKGVGATVAAMQRLTRLEARRLQLAAETGGGAGILLRPAARTASDIYAVSTRWLVEPAGGERTIQRWKIQLIHGHGGRIGQNVILERNRERLTLQAHPLRPAAQLANRSAAKKTAAAGATA